MLNVLRRPVMSAFLSIPRRRLVLLVALSAMLIAGCWTLTRAAPPRPMGSGPAGPPVDAAAFAQPWSDRPVVLLGIGDSVTSGYGASPGNSYFDRLVRPLPGDELGSQGVALPRVLPRLQAVNKGVACSISFEHVKTLAALKPWPADTLGVVLLTTGGNDLIHDYGRGRPRAEAMYGATWDEAQPWIAGFGGRLAAMLARLRQLFPGGCQVFIASIYDPTDGEGNLPDAGLGLPAWPDAKRIHRAYNDRIAALAAEHADVHLVDAERVLLGHGINHAKRANPHHDAADPTYWYYANLEDPNDRGYDAIRRAFLNAMIPVLRPR